MSLINFESINGEHYRKFIHNSLLNKNSSTERRAIEYAIRKFATREMNVR